MKTVNRELIQHQLTDIASRLSQAKLANKAGVSAATINHMINGKWELIKEEMWRRVLVNLKLESDWQHAPTNNFKIITGLLTAAQSGSMSLAISYREGHGKSHAYKSYERANENVLYVECKNYWTKRTYVQALLRAAGLNSAGTVGELIEDFVAHVQQLHKPLIIIDQADKLKDPQLDLFMDFYNDLEGHCAFILSGVPALEKRILRGVQRDKVGYREMYSRLGRKFISLDKTSLTDVANVCIANGCTDSDFHVQIYNQCEGDIRRVKRMVEQYFLTNKKNAA